MKLIALAGVLVLASAEAAQAEDWRYATSGDNLTVGYDLESIRSAGSLRTLWTVYVHAQSVTVGNITFDYHIIRSVIDCDAETKADRRFAYYSLSDRNPVYDYEDNAPPSIALPGSVSGRLIAKICGASEGGVSHGRSAHEFAEIARAQQ